MRVEKILAKAINGQRLSLEEGILLLKNCDLLALGQAANSVRHRIHAGSNIVTYVIDRNINYTNICACQCRFCAFYRHPGDPDAYVLDRQVLYQKVAETVEAGGTELLIQGGLNPALGVEYYEDLLRFVKSHFDIHLHCFSPPEIVHMAKISAISIEEALARLIEAGLNSLPGGGAEILVDRIRKKISPRKISWSQWMEVMDAAHRLGLKTTATMMFGHLESPEDRILHLVRVREQQDRSGGFTAFIPWTFQPGNTALPTQSATSVDYLKTLAVARLMIDNIPNLQVSWVTQGAKVAQVALLFGANDFGGTMLEENVVRAAGVSHRIGLAELTSCIEKAGFTPKQRLTDYTILPKT